MQINTRQSVLTNFILTYNSSPLFISHKKPSKSYFIDFHVFMYFIALQK